MSKRKKIFLIVAGLALVVLLFLALRPSPTPVSAMVVSEGYFAEHVEDEGRTRLRDTYMVTAPIGGFLRRVELEPGDEIEAGDTVFALEPTPAPALDARSREQARETLSAARARLEAAQATLETRRSETRLAVSEAQRHRQLYDRGVVSATQMERVESERDRAVSAERAAEAAVSVARFEVENARAVLEITEGQRSPDEDQILRVSAPVSGVILRRDRCCEGVIQAGERVLEIGDLADLEIQVDLLSMDAVRVRQGMRVILERWGGDEALEGRVRRVEPAGFQRISALGVEEQRVPVLIEIESDREVRRALGTDYRVEARIVLWEDDQVIQVPTSALFREADAWKVFVVENGRARLREVEIGRRSGLSTQVLDGLQPGERVITHPGDHISDGSRVTAQDRS